MGKRLYKYLKLRGIKVSGFVVTSRKREDDCLELSVLEKPEYLCIKSATPKILFYAIKNQNAFYELAAEGISVVHIPELVFQQEFIDSIN